MNEKPMSPGEWLRQDLRQQRITNADLARLLGRSPQYVTDIIKGKKALDVEVALELEQVMGEPKADEWMRRVLNYHRASVGLTLAEVLARHDYAKELIQLKWVENTKDPEKLDRALSEFWALQGKAANFRVSKVPTNEVAKRAWAIQVYRRAEEQLPLPPFEKARLESLYEELKLLQLQPEGLLKLKETLGRYGIRLVLLAPPKGCRVDGVASLDLDDQSQKHPYIGLSLRISRLDSVWFTLLHELGHIEAGHTGTPPSTIDAVREGKPDADEVKADELAQSHLLDQKRYDVFILRGDYSYRAIVEEAQEQSVHPSILIGRMKNDRILDWSQFAREHPPVRDLLMKPAV